MKHKRLSNIGLTVSASLLLIMGVILASALPVIAGPPKQDSWTPIPTPILYPVSDDDLDWTLKIVGGDNSPQTFPSQEVDGMTFGGMTVETDFPTKVTFRANITADREIDQVNMIRTYRNSAERILEASWDETTQTWTAVWPVARQIPAWAEVEFRWCARHTAGETVCTEPDPLTLVDPTQEWFRVENDYAILYWYGFGEDLNEQIANDFTYAVASTRPRLIEGFGRDISYKPIVVLYPDESSLFDQVNKDLITEGWFARFMAIHGLAFGFLLSPELPDLIAECPLAPPEERNFDWRLRTTLNYVAGGGAAGIFQSEFLGRPGGCIGYGGMECVNAGPDIWREAEYIWFSGGWLWDSDQRLRNLAPLETIPSVTSNFSSLTSTDGCVSVALDVGTSFINWLVLHYGIETHRQIVELMQYNEDGSRGMNFRDAIEQATGKLFDDLENEWRTYLGLEPLE